MFYEMRTYRLKVGAMPAYLNLVATEGIALQKKHLGELVAYFTTDIGPLNQIVHIWRFASLDDRDLRRKQLLLDAEWQVFMPKLQPLIEEMEIKIMCPTSFSPLQ
jgi:hypothetical protein